MAGDASLARLFRDYGDRWEIEKITRGSEWGAVLRDGDCIHIVTGHDFHSLRYRMAQAEREEPEEPSPAP